MIKNFQQYTVMLYYHKVINIKLYRMLIQLNNTQFAYPAAPNKTVINIDTWQIQQGLKHFLHGPSGSGKTTLLNLLTGISAPTGGEVYVLNEPLHKMNRKQRDKFRAHNIGYIFQKFNLIPYLNAIDNIKLAHYFSRSHSKTLDANIDDLLHTLQIPTTDWSRPVGQLSVGQQQRISIARAFINKPNLLIADEPTSSIDEDAKANFLSMLQTLCQECNTSLLFVSHDMSLQNMFDHSHSLPQINRPKGA
ncbi:ABC transporter ATP-binding protein [Catenovulum agarivorans DS-2]|uniref:ABC transporter ATP-binding protein n=1 Tax=Catenovulum agarivorans DS-2 TaxID=1328313 RepID=W7QD00_9ALTE|nr:ATP-binding cassette domain-containing protein [Catenovulum agarivorans]EWH10769.1 ABC transporter ATP-binding protein [Catenovulum agarivorans DS-2]